MTVLRLVLRCKITTFRHIFGYIFITIVQNLADYA